MLTRRNRDRDDILWGKRSGDSLVAQMLDIIDFRLLELRVLSNIADGTWAKGVSTGESAGQAASLGLTRGMYAEMIMTLLEDSLLFTVVDEIRRGLELLARIKESAGRDMSLRNLSLSDDYTPVSVTYRGIRRIEELRDQLRRDRVLDRFGILLDGRYIVSDLIRFLERTDGEPVSLLFADVDDFKRFNSEHGYKAGDAVLCNVFRAVRETIGHHGEAYRRGGEEIVVLLPYCGLDASTRLAERICDEVANTAVAYADKELRVTLSIGVAASPPIDPDGPALEAQAESALERAKNAGKNQVVVA